MALTFALVHWSAAAGPAASSKQAKTVETTVNRRVTGLTIPDTYDPATRQVNQKFGTLLEARRSRSAGRQVVDAELEGDDGARVAHHRRLPVDVEERGRLPVGKTLADEQRQADGHLRKAAPQAEDARGGGDGEEPAGAAQQFQGHGGRQRIVGRLGVGVEGLRGDGGAQRDIEGPQQDVGDRASQGVRPPASRVRHPRRGESDQEDPYRMPPRAYLHDAALPRATRVNLSGSARKACGAACPKTLEPTATCRYDLTHAKVAELADAQDSGTDPAPPLSGEVAENRRSPRALRRSDRLNRSFLGTSGHVAACRHSGGRAPIRMTGSG